METTFLTSGKVAKRLDVSEKTLRRWEKNGILLPHHKSTSGYKYYTEQQLYDFSLSYLENSKKTVVTKGNHVEATITEICADEQNSNLQVANERQIKACVAPYHYFSTSRLVR